MRFRRVDGKTLRPACMHVVQRCNRVRVCSLHSTVLASLRCVRVTVGLVRTTPLTSVLLMLVLSRRRMKWSAAAHAVLNRGSAIRRTANVSTVVWRYWCAEHVNAPVNTNRSVCCVGCVVVLSQLALLRIQFTQRRSSKARRRNGK